MAWLLAGLFVGQCVHLSHIARKLPGQSQKLSRVKMLSRLLDNRHIRVRPWYEPVARDLLTTAVNHGQTLRLLVDGSKVGNGHQLLMVALAYRRRALPIAWTWVQGKRGHSAAQKQCALLAYVHDLIPAGARVEIAGDSEFGAIEVLRLLDQWGWGYALRQKGSHLVCHTGQSTWTRCDTLVTQPGQSCWLDAVLLTQQHAYPTRFLALWQTGEAEPWLLATNLATEKETRNLYRVRMWIEAMFADFKGHGFDLEATRLNHFVRLSRLTLAIALLYIWIVTFASQTIKNGNRRLVDRADRRDLSIFRIRLDMLERCLANREPFSIRTSPYLRKVYGS
jgi:predicted RNA binding protein YcfA (HicA-like mRNA interferase family)